ncbi:MAG TPA: CHAT domain-containing protein, partial [Stellaceae bacterium]|nr:CHAT domain-containing protein [Stellaceae bacterium]
PALTAEAFEAGQLAQVSATSQALTGMAARFAGGSDALAALVREQQDTFNRWQVLDAELVKASSKPPKSRNSQEDAARLQELAALDRRLKELGERLVREFPRYAEIVSPRPVPLAEAQRLLAPDEALLVWSIGDEASFLWAVRQDRAMVARLSIGAKGLEAAVRGLRAALDPSVGIQGGRWPRFDTQAAYALYRQILAPAEPVIAGARHLLVIPDGALQSLPLGVLVTQAPARPIAEYRDYRQVPWLMRRYAMSVLPSVSALPALRGYSAPAQAKQPFAGIGDPVLEGQGERARAVNVAGLFRGASVDVALLRQLPPLPEAADELRAEARLLGAGESDLYLRERATVPRVMQANLRDYRVVAFATHAAVGGELEGLAEPALVMTPPAQASEQDDGLLTASRVAQLKLDADWVVLSACNTAAGDGTPGAEGLSGLAKAFFYAGTRAVLVSHWPVFSKAAVKLTTTAFEAMAKEPRLGRAQALQKAMLSMVDSDNEPLLGHPMLWAPFVIVGEGAPGR